MAASRAAPRAGQAPPLLWTDGIVLAWRSIAVQEA